jgi:hypothetical protein
MERGMKSEQRTDPPLKNENGYELEPTETTARADVLCRGNSHSQNPPFAETSFRVVVSFFARPRVARGLATLG